MTLSGLEQFLVVVSTVAISYDELDPPGFAAELVRQFNVKKLIWQDGQHYLPNIIHIFVPPMKPKRLEELEAIFNSHAFFEHIYNYVGELNCKLFDYLRVEIDVLPGVAYKRTTSKSTSRCLVRMEWPNTKQASSGLDVIVEANAQRIIKVGLPPAEIERFALLQPINARSYREHFLIVKRLTRLGRARNVIGTNGELIVCNDFPFARTGDRVNQSVSRQHAQIEYHDEEFYLLDCSSRRGTAIKRFNGSWQEIKVTTVAEGGVRLADRDIIRLGDALLSFEFIAPEQCQILSKRLLTEGRLDTGMVNDETENFQKVMQSFSKYINHVEVV